MDKKDKIIPVKKLSEEALRALNEANVRRAKAL